MLSARQKHCLKGIGIRHWVERSTIAKEVKIAEQVVLNDPLEDLRPIPKPRPDT